jgi:hypothetical protein
MKDYFINELDDDMSPEAEERLWDSAGRKPTKEEWMAIAEWASVGFFSPHSNTSTVLTLASGARRA